MYVAEALVSLLRLGTFSWHKWFCGKC